MSRACSLRKVTFVKIQTHRNKRCLPLHNFPTFAVWQTHADLLTLRMFEHYPLYVQMNHTLLGTR